ncbi:MAG TPA: YidC/Oxa1 family membrane protein insertase [Actinomycetota bacterium]
MAELFGAIEKGLGIALNAIYEAVPSYGVAIVLLTVGVRAVLWPLGVRQIHGMKRMQAAQPEIKAVQSKYREMQKKVKNRAELMALRQEQQKETSEVMRKHGASFAGGCGPALYQMPILIAMFSVMRAAALFVPTGAASLAGASIAPDFYTEQQLKATVCVQSAEQQPADAGALRITCFTEGEDAPEPTDFNLTGLEERNAKGQSIGMADVAEVAFCQPLLTADGKATSFQCRSTLGTGHLPRDGALFADISTGKAQAFWMHSGCSATQAGSESGLRTCSPTSSDAGPLGRFPYYLVVLLIAASQYVSSKQMMARQASKGAATQQQQQAQQMTTRLLPLVFGFISLNFPSGTNVYYLTYNLWQWGQQTVMFRREDAHPDKPAAPEKAAPPPAKGSPAPPPDSPEIEGTIAQEGAPARPHPRSKKKKRRKKR